MLEARERAMDEAFGKGVGGRQAHVLEAQDDREDQQRADFDPGLGAGVDVAVVTKHPERFVSEDALEVARIGEEAEDLCLWPGNGELSVELHRSGWWLERSSGTPVRAPRRSRGVGPATVA